MRLQIDTSGLVPGDYTVSAAVAWEQHKPGPLHVVDYPPMRLARAGRGDDGWHPIALLDLSCARCPLAVRGPRQRGRNQSS